MSAQTDIYRAAFALIAAIDKDVELVVRLLPERDALRDALADGYAEDAIIDSLDDGDDEEIDAMISQPVPPDAHLEADYEDRVSGSEDL